MTVGREIKEAVSNGSELRKMTEQLNEFADAVDANPLIKSALPGPTAEAAAAGELDADLSGRIRAALDEAASSTGRETELMAPQAPGAGTATLQTNSASRPVDPRAAGLSPEWAKVCILYVIDRVRVRERYTTSKYKLPMPKPPKKQETALQPALPSTVGAIEPGPISDEMRRAYIDYAMSVIVARALPDVRDGFKPVHRRILYSMWKNGLRSTAKFKKCAAVVGDVLAKYHPHGDMAVYDSLVRMAQDFSLRYPLVRGQGNFGSLDGDNAAAYRYTESKLQAIAEEMLYDIEKETVPFAPNFDGSEKEPTVLPAKLPNLLLNGTLGIAVGMATNIPPHNLTEVCDGIVALIENPDIEVEDLMKLIKGPDFPLAA